MLIVSLLTFYKDGFGTEITHEGWYAIKQRNQTKLFLAQSTESTDCISAKG